MTSCRPIRNAQHEKEKRSGNKLKSMQLFAQKHNRHCGTILTLNPIWSENKFTMPFGHDLSLDEKHDGTYTIEHNDL